MASMSETVSGGQVAESVRNTGVLGADGPPKCGKSEGKIRVAPMMDDVESCNIPSEDQRLDGRRIGAWVHFVPT